MRTGSSLPRPALPRPMPRRSMACFFSFAYARPLTRAIFSSSPRSAWRRDLLRPYIGIGKESGCSLRHIRAGHWNEDRQRLAAASSAEPDISAQNGLLLKSAATRPIQRCKAAELCIWRLHHITKHLESTRTSYHSGWLQHTHPCSGKASV